MADATPQANDADGQKGLSEQIARAVGIAPPGAAPANDEPGPTEAQTILNEPVVRAVNQVTDIANWFGVPAADMQGDLGNKLFSLPPAQLAAFHDDAKISYDKNGGKTPLTGTARDDALNSATAKAAAAPGADAEKTQATISEAFAAVGHENRPVSSAAPSPAPQTSAATTRPHPAKPVSRHHAAGAASPHAPRDRQNGVVETSSIPLTSQELEHHAAGIGLPTKVEYTTPVALHGKDFEISVALGPGNTPTVFTVNSGSFHFQGNESDAHRAMRRQGMSDKEANAALSGEKIGDTNHASVAAHLNGEERDAYVNERLAYEAALAAQQRTASTASRSPNSVTSGGTTYTDDGKNAAPAAGTTAQPPAIPNYLPSAAHPGYVDGNGGRAQGPYAGLADGAPPVYVASGYGYGGGGNGRSFLGSLKEGITPHVEGSAGLTGGSVAGHPLIKGGGVGVNFRR